MFIVINFASPLIFLFFLFLYLGKGIGADFARAYISNVCVAAELQRNGLAYALIAESKIVAEKWGKRILINEK